MKYSVIWGALLLGSLGLVVNGSYQRQHVETDWRVETQPVKTAISSKTDSVTFSDKSVYVACLEHYDTKYTVISCFERWTGKAFPDKWLAK